MISDEIKKSLIIFATSGALSFVSAPLLSLVLIPIAKRLGAIDVPRDGRRMHKDPIPRIGGIAVLAAFALGASFFLAYCHPLFTNQTQTLLKAMLLGGSVIAVGGLADDIYTLSPSQKIFYQLFAALTVVISGVRAPLPYPFTALPDPVEAVLSALFTVFWCVLLTNSFNLIDGLDGLCASSASFCLLALFAMSGGEELTLVYLLSAVLGFLPLNLRPAKLFLGDAGAMLLGLSLAVLSINILQTSPDMSSYAAMPILFAIPLFDTLFAVIRRMINGKSPFSPDRQHLHHRLVDAGLSHANSSLFLSLLVGGFAALGSIVYRLGFSAISVISLFLLIFPALSVIIITVNKDPRTEQEKKDEKG